MAYANRWSITFKDIDNNTRIIYIQQNGWDGGVTQLIPGSEPLVIDEDYSEDLTNRVRGITGRIEVIEETFGELSALYPQWPLQNRVVCDGVFFGYIKVQNSTVGWESGPRRIKLNILSPLAMAKDMPMPLNTTMGLREVGSVMSDLLTTLNYSYIVMPGGTASVGDFFRGSIRGMLICPYANDKDYHYANDAEIFEPISCGDLLEYICERHDLICHELMANSYPLLMFQRMVSPDTYYRWTTENITNGNYNTATTYQYVGNTKKAILTEFSVADSNNTEQLVLPYSRIDITHEGEAGEEIVDTPTQHSEWLNGDYYNLLVKKGIWLDNLNQYVRLQGAREAKPGTTGSDFDDYEIVDELDINPQTSLSSNTLLFTVAFYNIDPKINYQLKFKYSHKRESTHDYLYISARGKSGWFTYNGYYPTPSSQTEDKILTSLDGGQNYEESYECTVPGLKMVTDEYIIINFYVGSATLERLKIWDIHLEGQPYQNAEFAARYAEQRFVERLEGGLGSKKLNIGIRLNKTFFSNYYDSLLAFSYPEYTFLLNTQRRIRIVVKGEAITFFWYCYRYYLNNQNEIWKLVAVSRNIRDNTYTLTLHNSTSF